MRWLGLSTVLGLLLAGILFISQGPGAYKIYSWVTSDGTVKVGRTQNNVDSRVRDYSSRYGITERSGGRTVIRGVATDRADFSRLDAKINRALRPYRTAVITGASELYDISIAKANAIVRWTIIKHKAGVLFLRVAKVLGVLGGIIGIGRALVRR